MNRLLVGSCVVIIFLLSAATFGYIYNTVVIPSSGQVIQNLGACVPRWLSAVPIASGEIGLSWRFDDYPGLVGYNIYRSVTSGSGYVKINSNPVTVTSYVDNGLTNGQTYYYVARVEFSNGTESANSNEASAAATSYSSDFYVYRIIGGGEHPAFDDTTYDSRTGPRYYIASVSVGDLNGDGLMDFVCWQKGSNARLVAFLHDGTYLWEKPFDIQEKGHNCRVVVGDVDGDGKAEVISHDKYEGYYLRVIDGLTGAVKKQIATDAPPENRANVALADLNGNGIRDAIIFVFGGDKLNNRVTAFDGNLQELWTFTTPHAGGHWVKVEDLDGDGKDEVLLGGADFVDDNGVGIPVDYPQTSGTYGHVDAVAVGDFDWSNPGLEVIFAGCYGMHIWMVNSNGKLMWDNYPGHAHWVSMGDFDPTVDGLEAFASYGDNRYHRIYYHDGSYKDVSRYDDMQPMMDWDGDWSDGDELHPIRNFNYIRITNAYTGQALFSYSGKSSGNRGVDITGDYRDEYIWPDCANRRIVIFSNGDHNSNQPLPSKWDDSFWRLESKYKHSFASDYINGALVY